MIMIMLILMLMLMRMRYIAVHYACWRGSPYPALVLAIVLAFV